MEQRFIIRGLGAGALAGLVAFVFARIFAEPYIQQAIDYERGRDAAKDALNRAAGLPPDPPEMDVFTRGVQRNIGIGVGLLLFGIAMGALFAVAYYIAYKRTHGRIRPRVLALMVAGAGFLCLYLVPFLKYPANPPAIGHPETIKQRSALYLGMVLIALVALTLGIVAQRRLRGRFGDWTAMLLAALGFAVVVGIAMAILPPLGHLHVNVVNYGHFATETPQPLRDPKGAIVYPGFPADTLFKFRLYTMIDQIILWGTIGLGAGALVERMLAREGEERVPPDLAATPG